MISERIIAGLITLLIIITAISILKVLSFFTIRKTRRSLSKLAQENNETIQQYDHWNSSAIGLGSTGKQIFIVNNSGGEIKRQTVNLNLFKKSLVINDNSKAPFKDGNFKVTDKIVLELSGMNNLTHNISFYSIEKDGPLLTDELQLAEKWCKLVDQSLT